MKVTGTILSTLGSVLFFAAALSAEHVKTDYNRSVDFHQFHTYSWETVRTADPLWVDRIKSAVDSVLAGKGWTRVESAGDVAIVAVEMTHNQQTLNTFYDNFGRGWRWGAASAPQLPTLKRTKWAPWWWTSSTPKTKA